MSDLPQIPNLYGCDPEPERIYQLYFSKLMVLGRWERILEAATQVEEYAKPIGPFAGLFLFSFRLEAFWSLDRFSEAFSVWERFDQVAPGSPQYKVHQKRNCAAPSLYYLRRYDEGREILENYLELSLRYGGQSLQLINDVMNNDVIPTHPLRVTLWHFYGQLNRSLLTWSLWPEFVSLFSPSRLKRSGVIAAHLAEDPELLLKIIRGPLRQTRSTSPSPEVYVKREKSPLMQRVERWFPEICEQQ